MSCEKCKELGKTCTGMAPNLCPQCAVAGLKPEDCVYLDDSLKLTVPAWYTRGAAGGGGGGGGGGVASALNAPIQPAVPNRAGAGLAAIRRPTGRGSPTGIENENVNEENEVNSNASRDPNATEAEIAAGKAKKQARRNKVARNLAASRLNAGNESAKAVQAMAAAAGAGGKRKRKSRKQTLKRKQKFTRKQK
jgi:hypothetical protein